ncbi:hypothetical protein AMECASPLE_028267 [Ameca splendens]|uniref:Uncharacterized protein n=1 Tax=Ameca splendens TaxID=208324 RepID=A0ABV0Z3B7_9TELE
MASLSLLSCSRELHRLWIFFHSDQAAGPPLLLFVSLQSHHVTFLDRGTALLLTIPPTLSWYLTVQGKEPTRVVLTPRQVDLSSFYIGLSTRTNCNIFSYDYSGYGVSTGKPTKKNLYADRDAAEHALCTRYCITPYHTCYTVLL